MKLLKIKLLSMGAVQVNDWAILIIFLVIGGIAEYLVTKKVEDRKKQNRIIMYTWGGIGIILIMIAIFS
ncbi:hypothetical protein [Aquibacillus koreensis]|uniref:hypothetical protein n=1 Tax=Aquibacillus koreensis TaxID=279446 RepID=UPI002341A539|nr:hypothetical protein [Aquibacillus koreensis]